MNRHHPHISVSLALASGLVLGTTGCSSVPHAAPAAESAVTVGSTTTDGTTVLAATTVGDDVFALGQREGEIRSVASFDGSSTDLNWQTFGEPAEVGSTAFTVVDPMNFPDAASDGIATVTGQVGADVSGIDVVTGDGPTIAATVHDGYWIAAWEGGDFAGGDTPDPSFVVHLADGTSTTVPYADTLEG